MGQAKEKGGFLREFLLKQGRVWGLVSAAESGKPLCSLSVELLGPLMGKAGAMDGPNFKSCCRRTSRHYRSQHLLLLSSRNSAGLGE